MAVFTLAPMPETALPCPPALQPRWALFLDVDGSLLDFASRPDAVEVPEGLVPALAQLSRALDGAVALVSGRPLDQLDALFAPLRLPGAGLHGLQVREDIEAAPPAVDTPAEFAHVLDRAQAIVDQHPGALVEDKGCTLAFHWRNAPAAAAPFHALAQDALGLLPHYRPQPGHLVLELRPDGFDKGSAIRQLMTRPVFAGRIPVFIGDDLTDEHGFIAVNALDGISVLVGDRTPTDARYRLDHPQALRKWLADAADRLQLEKEPHA